MVNIKMHEFKHPNYYKELRQRNKEEARAQLKVPSSNLDQAISDEASTEATSVHPGPGNKLDVPAPAGPSVKPQAPSDKHQALKLSNQPQASSAKRQASQPE